MPMILIDDLPYREACPAGMTVRELAHSVCADAGPADRRLVVGIYRDGQAVPEGELNAVLDAPVVEFPELALQTQPVVALVGATLDQALAMLDDAGSVRTAAADLLDQGRQSEAMAQLQKLLDIWRQTQQTLTFSAEALGIELDALTAGDCRCTEVVDRMRSHLEGLREAMLNQDPVLIADLLRYELDEVFAQWQQLLAGLRDSCSA